MPRMSYAEEGVYAAANSEELREVLRQAISSAWASPAGQQLRARLRQNAPRGAYAAAAQRTGLAHAYRQAAIASHLSAAYRSAWGSGVEF